MMLEECQCAKFVGYLTSSGALMDCKKILKFNMNLRLGPFKESKKARKSGMSRMGSVVKYP